MRALHRRSDPFKLLVVVGLLLAGCGEPAPIETTLAALASAQADFDGRVVVVSGKLQTFDEPRHYWIENDQRDRVALQGASGLEPLVGRRVEVQGRFLYDRTKGRRVEVTLLRPL